jgi:enamine deaminase RidA (YjgF/YER057c/UK114 family)
LVAIAGQVAMDAYGNLVGEGDPGAQAEQVFRNLGLALAAAGGTFAHVIKFGIFVTDVAFLPAIREVRDRYIDTARPPASTAIQVASLFRPEFLMEIDALAVVSCAPSATRLAGLARPRASSGRSAGSFPPPSR